MPIQWYPGHMVKARRVLAETMRSHDVIVEVVDARLPRSSANPLIDHLRRGKPCVKVLSKSDLADPDLTSRWLSELRSDLDGDDPVVTLALAIDRPKETKKRLGEQIQRVARRRSGPGNTVRALVCGIPNVGKSTLINTLMDRKVAKVGDEPAVTKARQQVILADGTIIADNPGLMWPKIEVESTGYRLAFSGAIPDAAIDYESVGVFGVALLARRYPELLSARYKLADLPDEPVRLLEAIGKKRGCLQKGGSVDMHKAADVIIHDFRTGKIGRITLESPEDPIERAPRFPDHDDSDDEPSGDAD